MRAPSDACTRKRVGRARRAACWQRCWWHGVTNSQFWLDELDFHLLRGGAVVGKLYCNHLAVALQDRDRGSPLVDAAARSLPYGVRAQRIAQQ